MLESNFMLTQTFSKTFATLILTEKEKEKSFISYDGKNTIRLTTKTYNLFTTYVKTWKLCK